jgi:hypothetical protein
VSHDRRQVRRRLAVDIDLGQVRQRLILCFVLADSAYSNTADGLGAVTEW